MPTYEFACKDCKNKYETITSYDKTEKYKDVECPHCDSKKKTKLLSSCSHAFTNPVGTDKWSKHDYRFKHNIPNVKKERETAEALSHMGTTPYGGGDMRHNDVEMDTGIHDTDGPTRLTDYS